MRLLTMHYSSDFKPGISLEITKGTKQRKSTFFDLNSK